MESFAIWLPVKIASPLSFQPVRDSNDDILVFRHCDGCKLLIVEREHDLTLPLCSRSNLGKTIPSG
jgi:hypothetical protein